MGRRLNSSVIKVTNINKDTKGGECLTFCSEACIAEYKEQYDDDDKYQIDEDVEL